MKRAIITVGLGFGDEGKGATVDYLTRLFDAGCVVRYCGGSQAGHNVQLPGGQRHTFSQFAAGTLAGARTYLGPRMIISPTTMVPEAEHLEQLGVVDPWSKLAAHPDCLVATGYHAWMNRLRESARGSGRHGSCGLGIGETRSYWLQHGQDAIVAADLRDRSTLIAKLRLLRDRLLLEIQQLPRYDKRWSEALQHTFPAEEAAILQSASNRLVLCPKPPESDTVIFEGAQGALLDEWKGFHPYTTWSTVTPHHAWEMLADEQPEDVDVRVIGITRAYTTRHGAGPMPTFCPSMSRVMGDPGNPRNDWQGAMRFGPLDLVLTEYAARVCNIDGIFVSGLDQIADDCRVATRYRDVRTLAEPRDLRSQSLLTESLADAAPHYESVDEEGLIGRLEQIAPVTGLAHGPTHLDRQWIGPTLVNDPTGAAIRPRRQIKSRSDVSASGSLVANGSP